MSDPTSQVRQRRVESAIREALRLKGIRLHDSAITTLVGVVLRDDDDYVVPNLVTERDSARAEVERLREAFESAVWPHAVAILSIKMAELIAAGAELAEAVAEHEGRIANPALDRWQAAVTSARDEVQADA